LTRYHNGVSDLTYFIDLERIVCAFEQL